MSMTRLFLEAADDAKALSESLRAIANEIADRAAAQPGTTSEAIKEEPTEVPKAEKSVTLEEVRAVLAEKSRAGLTAEVKELIAKHGADKLSDVDPAEYAEMLKEAEALDHAG